MILTDISLVNLSSHLTSCIVPAFEMNENPALSVLCQKNIWKRGEGQHPIQNNLQNVTEKAQKHTTDAFDIVIVSQTLSAATLFKMAECLS